MPDRALRGGANAPLCDSIDALTRRIIEQIELGALDARTDTLAFGAAIADRLATWFPSAATATCREASS